MPILHWEFFWPKLRKCRMKSSYRRRRRLVSPRIQKEKRKKKKLPISHLSPSCWKTSLLLPSLANRFSRCRWGNSLVKVVTCRRALTKNQKGKIGILYSWLGEINRPQFKREPYALVAKCFNLFWFFLGFSQNVKKEIKCDVKYIIRNNATTDVSLYLTNSYHKLYLFMKNKNKN